MMCCISSQLGEHSREVKPDLQEVAQAYSQADQEDDNENAYISGEDAR